MLVVAIWGSNFVIIRFGLESLPPLLFACLRFVFAVLPAIFFLPRPDLPWRNLASYGVLSAAQFGLLFLAMRGHISPGLASLVLQAQVFFTLMLARRISRERVQAYQWLALLLAASGIAVIVVHTDGSVTVLGLLLILAAAFCWASANLVVKSAGRVNMLAYVVWTSAYAVPPLLRGIGGDLYLPIPFARGCKITLDQVPFYYIVNYRSYASTVQVETFSMDGYAAAQDAVDAASEALLAAPDLALSEPGQQATLAPGQELALDLPPGAAAVRNIRVQVAPGAAPQALRSIVLTAEFDGEAAIWCPIGEFFGAGARLNPVQDRFRTVRADGAMFSRWIMPYQSSGRLALKNLGSVPVTVTLAAVTAPWQWDERSLLFHANWRFQGAFNTMPTFDWNYIEIQGRGVYVGDTLTAFNRHDYWYGEGDERVYIDGDTFPSHLGTGTEDYYGYAWGMTGFFSSPFISQPQRDAQSGWKGFTTTSRVRMLDAIPLRSSFKLDMEISHHTSTQLDYAVGTFWYARPGATHNRPPQPAAAALPLATF